MVGYSQENTFNEIFSILVDTVGERGYTTVSNREVSDRIGYSMGCVDQNLRLMEAYGIIRRETRRSQHKEGQGMKRKIFLLRDSITGYSNQNLSNSPKK